jgi:single-stranded-DNA-specific exonuclease
MNKVWEIKKEVPKNFLEKHKDYQSLLLQLLYNRNIKTKKEIDDFLSIDYQKDVYDPFLLSGIKKAVNRIKEAISNNQKIAIFGDYDADGICASTILYQTLKKIGTDPLIYIPDRKKGYGLNNSAIRELSEKSVKLIITVDCGVSDKEETDLANFLGLDVIITDHHLMPDILPKAHAIINPKKKGEKYPNKDLSGTGVAFKLATAIIKTYGDIFQKEEEKWLLDLVAIATVADMMNLKGENRTLVKYGLLVLAKTRRLGLKALLKEAGVTNVKVKWIDKKNNRFRVQNVDAYTIGFIIGPRLNAAGRMDHANKAFFLINADIEKEAIEIAKELSLKNQARQRLQLKTFKEIQSTVSQEELDEKKVIIRGHKNYPKGIVGLISGKVTDRYYRPSFIYQEEEEISKGSCRGIPEVNIVDVLNECKSYLKEFGGHKAAAGFSFKTVHAKKLTECLCNTIKKVLHGKKLLKKVKIDAVLNFSDINYDLKKTLEELEPFGQGNPEPIFAIENVQIMDIKKIGAKEQHLLLNIRKKEERKECYLRAILFENAISFEGINKENAYDFAFTPMFDEWQGEKRITLKILDWRLSKNPNL